ncbi:MAG: hypothetical protein C4562_04475 [Actinobacteria bacterium]|nr:MAG: hypothetical protein C4562_04475 [Actinomycetota bacterium]
MKKIVVICLVLVVVLALSGCDSIFKSAAKQAVEKATGVKVDEDGKSVKIKTKEGEAEISSSQTKLPDGFPEDFPVYDGAKLTNSAKMGSAKEAGYTAVWETSDSKDDVVDFYKKELPSKGYKVTAEYSSGQGTTYTFEQGYLNIVEKTSTKKVEISTVISIKNK